MAIPYDLQLTESNRRDRHAFTSMHWMGYRLADERILIDLTGVVIVGMIGEKEWSRKRLRVDLSGGRFQRVLKLPRLTDSYWHLEPDMWSVAATPAAVFNRNTAVNAGWAVDNCNTAWDLGDSRQSHNPLFQFPIYLDLATRDTDGILYRVSFDFRAVGTLSQKEITID